MGIDRQDLPQGATAASRRAEIDHDAASSVGLRSQGRATAGGVVTPMLAALLWPVPYQPRIMTLRDKLPIGFIVPAQPVEREAPPVGADWVHQIKHDGCGSRIAVSFMPRRSSWRLWSSYTAATKIRRIAALLHDAPAEPVNSSYHRICCSSLQCAKYRRALQISCVLLSLAQSFRAPHPESE